MKKWHYLISLPLFLTSYSAAFAASLKLNPPSGIYIIGEKFEIIAALESKEDINAAEGVIEYSPEKLELISVSKEKSIFNFWTTDPKDNITPGKISFAGASPHTFSGKNQEILRLTFIPKTSGSAEILLSSGAIFAADGKGTNVIEELKGAALTIIPRLLIPPAEGYISPSSAPQAPVINSPTHPDINRWYKEKNAVFRWSSASDFNAVRMRLDRSPASIPDLIIEEPLTAHRFENLEDGTHYFHLQLRNRNGWGGISHFRINIDARPPSNLEAELLTKDDPSDPRPKFKLSARDETSGILRYVIIIDGGKPTERNEKEIFESPLLPPGEHQFLFRVEDRAGNFSETSRKVKIEPLPSPVLREYPVTLEDGEPLIIKGASLPFSRIKIWIKRNEEEAQNYEIKSGEDGNFTFVWEKRPSEGIYKIWAETLDQRDARSLHSSTLVIAVGKPILFRIGKWAIDVLAVIIPMLALLFLLIALLWLGYHRFSAIRRRLKKEVKEAETSAHQAFSTISKYIQKYLAMLEGTRNERALTPEERKLLMHLKADLAELEHDLIKEIEDIEKEVK